ncbi:S9 family peptidase [Curtobacterium sp. MCBD17_034]|uniref:S9 family peptidase n=1 Tax=unclassified Curtobacterium TaxID=257496 RepID=UPI000DA8907D|nr:MULTISPECIES: prolyl oligopeptidase family serine peptidase [unclassified Curtobacterium]PZF61149.1 S9 family peptidase [Curtobacterium sp. MCBD17_034]PZM40498.1 S9 family peptidase [Curtobacterium sp. MCBD17_031]
MTSSLFADLDSFIRHPRVTGLALSHDGARVVATVQEPDADAARYRSALWEVDPVGDRPPVRLTSSEQGESSPAFTPSGDLLFTSSRPDPRSGENTEDPALWSLPEHGEPIRVATSPGGVGSPLVSRSGVVIVTGSRLVGSSDADEDRARRERRKDQAVTAILHDGMPIRWWDHELDDTEARLLVLDDAGATAPDAARASDREARPTPLRDLAPDAGQRFRNPEFDIAPDGSFVLARATERVTRGRSHAVLLRIDVATGERSVVVDEDGADASQARIAPDASRFAVAMRVRGTYDSPHQEWIEVRSIDGGAAVRLDLGDITANDVVWTADGTGLLVTGDLHGAGAVVLVDPTSGAIVRWLVTDASYSNLLVHPDGRTLFALRSAMDRPASPVRLDVTAEDQTPAFLPAPGVVDTLPGTVQRVSAEVDGVEVPGWLFLPDDAHRGDGPAPVMTWVHGGPFSSWNAWSWRWCPWLAVERGYAVVLPDPALSTGYGDEWIARAWPHRAAIVWREIEGVLEAVLADSDHRLDPTRTALLGASFGGYMTNWIAGHTDRFDCIVTHAGLWSLDQQHDTTDAAENKNGIFGTEQEHPDWYAQNSPDRTAEAITTPMLLIHGNRDYRVPISEALRAWWDLVSGFPGAPEDMPHRFLQLTSENHWVLSPSNFRVWSETVFTFCDQHVRGGEALTNRID